MPRRKLVGYGDRQGNGAGALISAALLVPDRGCFQSGVYQKSLFLAVFVMFVRSSVAGSAVGSGCCGWLVRPSAHAQSGWVLVASFSSFAGAGRFARRWAGRASRFVLVRRVAAGWAVSVPVLSA